VSTRLRKFVEPINWKHALGEFVLIVTGILIALWLNDWNEDKRDRRAELQLLREMRTALAEDLEDNETDYQAFKQTRARLLRLESHLQQRQPHSASVDSLFGALVLTRVLRFNAGPYEVLRARGFELLSDDSLRSQIVHYYGTTYPFMAMRYARVDEFVREYSQAYFLRNFRGATRSGDVVVALAYEQVARDPYLANLVAWHSSELDVMVSRYENTLAEGKSLLQALGRQIERIE
jgi:hypothetical protein